jgi:hypothetical protein
MTREPHIYLRPDRSRCICDRIDPRGVRTNLPCREIVCTKAAPHQTIASQGRQSGFYTTLPPKARNKVGR